MSDKGFSWPPVRETVARFKIAARKGLGQNFLCDLNLTRRIVRAAGPLDGMHVLEVGPGPGGLTRALLESQALHVRAVEMDERCIKALEELGALTTPGRLTIVHGNALAFDAVKELPAPRAVVANLPYHIATPLLIGWLKRIDSFESLTLMFQREVAERIIAKPGGKTYGRLSVICQWLTRPEIVVKLPPSAFVPPPSVDSAVVRFTPRQGALSQCDFQAMERVTAAAFGQRRKTLRNALSGLFADPSATLMAASIDPSLRAEAIPVADFIKLAQTPEATGRHS
ncbi:MAG: 16S rRNA (adenine(1518)-N(6)/adenine(1519)-N(6))-dimethyltransferase RsmA [Pseudomonadota bacterium]|nr:16S rRNA (adenine(1518)-N(6)/adenine(1519)-N(6))-dimethyltransferase RsmA [Pseudomonadota bacterium]